MRRILLIFAWTAGVYYGSNAIITGILFGIALGICHHRGLDVHSYLVAHISLVDLLGVVLNVLCLLLAAVALVLGVCGLLPGTKNGRPVLSKTSRPSPIRATVWTAAILAIITGFIAFIAWGVYSTFIQGTTPGPDFISALQSSRIAASTISSIEVVEPTRGDMPFTAKELDSLPRRAKIDSPATINQLLGLLNGAQAGMWPRNMNHPGSVYAVWLKVNTRDGFFWLYFNVDEDYDGSVFSIQSNTRNGTNPNGATRYHLENFSQLLEILSNAPLWTVGPARTSSQSDSTYFRASGLRYDFYDSKSNRFATVTLVLPSPILETQLNGWWYGNLANSYVRPRTNFVFVGDKLNVKSARFICHRDPEHPSVAAINLNPDEPDDYITLYMRISNQPITGRWIYSTDTSTVDSGTFTGPIQK
jgi:hypothetical protein